LRESFRIPYGQVSQNLAIQDDFRIAERADQTAVCDAVLTGSRVDAHNPEPAQVAFAITAVVIGVPLALHVSFIGALKQMISGSSITAVVGYPTLVASAAVWSTLYSCHFIISFAVPWASDFHPVAHTQQPR
jgi:hypothetical protein